MRGPNGRMRNGLKHLMKDPAEEELERERRELGESGPAGEAPAADLMESKWREMDAIMVQNGIGMAQRRVMAQAFYGGAYACADVLRVAFNEAETPDGFVGVMDTVLSELTVIKEKGVPPVIGEEGGEGGNLIVMSDE